MGRPQKSAVYAANATALGDMAQPIRDAADKMLEAADRVHNTVYDFEWEGASKDGADRRADREITQDRAVGTAQHALADAYENGAKTMQPMIDSLKSKGQGLEADDFAVSEDWVVTDTYDYDSARKLAPLFGLSASDVDALQSQRANTATTETVNLQRLADELGTADANTTTAINNAKAALADAAKGASGLGAGPFRIADGHPVIEGTDGDDQVTVTQDPKTGVVTVTINGESNTYTADEARGMVIETRGGDDTVVIAPGIVAPKDDAGEVHYDQDGNLIPTPIGFKVEAGAGNDRVRGGSGRDYINGSTGNDVIDGGDGNDVIYGGDGNDVLFGGAGNDYIDGGKGNDVLFGGDGNDLVHGGQGDDLLFGGKGDDVVITGAGIDQVWNDGGTDVIKAQVGEDIVNPPQPDQGTNVVQNTVLGDIPDNIQVFGDPEFRERTEADLELYRSTDSGKAMLSALGDAKDTEFVIAETSKPNSWSYPIGAQPNPSDPTGSIYVDPDQQLILYNPSFDTTISVHDPTTGEVIGNTEFTPATTLFHEMAHSYDFAHGNIGSDLYDRVYSGSDPVDRRYGNINNSERVAVGLPIDDDNNTDTPERLAPSHSAALTENGLRHELGLPKREHYGS